MGPWLKVSSDRLEDLRIEPVTPGLQGDWFIHSSSTKIIRIHQECEGRIEKSVLRITDWHHEACLVMTIADHEGWIFSFSSSQK